MDKRLRASAASAPLRPLTWRLAQHAKRQWLKKEPPLKRTCSSGSTKSVHSRGENAYGRRMPVARGATASRRPVCAAARVDAPLPPGATQQPPLPVLVSLPLNRLLAGSRMRACSFTTNGTTSKTKEHTTRFSLPRLWGVVHVLSGAVARDTSVCVHPSVPL